MTGLQALDVAREAVYTMLLVALPMMAVSMIVGLTVAVFQALTQIQETTLTFVPKIIVLFGSLVVFLPFMVDQLGTLMSSIADKIVAIGGP